MFDFRHRRIFGPVLVKRDKFHDIRRQNNADMSKPSAYFFVPYSDRSARWDIPQMIDKILEVLRERIFVVVDCVADIRRGV